MANEGNDDNSEFGDQNIYIGSETLKKINQPDNILEKSSSVDDPLDNPDLNISQKESTEILEPKEEPSKSNFEFKEKWIPPKPKKPEPEKITAYRRVKNQLEYKEFKEDGFYSSYLKKPDIREKIKALYPYFEIDLAAAFEEGGQRGGEQVVEEMMRRINDTRINLQNYQDVNWCEIPKEYADRVGDFIDQGTINYGYQRHWVQFIDKTDPNFVIEILWHRHDGYGGKGGQVDVWVDRIDRRVAHLE